MIAAPNAPPRTVSGGGDFSRAHLNKTPRHARGRYWTRKGVGLGSDLTISCKVVAMSASRGTISCSWRRELSKNSRLAAFNYLMAGVGLAALKLAEIEHGRKAREQANKEAYYRAIGAMDTAAA